MATLARMTALRMSVMLEKGDEMRRETTRVGWDAREEERNEDDQLMEDQARAALNTRLPSSVPVGKVIEV